MSIRLMLSATFAAAVSLAMGGCLYFPNNRSDRDDSDTRPSSTTTTGTGTTRPGYYNEVGEGEMFQGTLGNVASFASDAPEMRITGSASSAYVRFDAVSTGPRWWAMVGLTITGGLNHASLRPGAHLTFSNRTSSTAGALRVSALGCSGVERDRYTYDRTADTVTIDVMPGSEPGRNRMVFSASYTNNGAPQNIQGSFEYDPR